MSCFIRERNVLQGENPVNVYITERGRTVAKYPSAVNVRHSVFSRLHPALQLSILRRKAEKGAKESDMRKKVGQFVLEREEREKARMARQKQKKDEREQKHETPDETPLSPASVPFRELKEKKGRLKRLADIGMLDYLTEAESKAVSGISPEMAEKVRKNPPLLPEMPKGQGLWQRIIEEMNMDYDRSGLLYYADNMIKDIEKLITPRSPLNTYYYKVIDYINKIKRKRGKPFASITESEWNRVLMNGSNILNEIDYPK